MQLMPFRTLQHYKAAYLSDDLTAGLSVFLASLPLCLGIALASGAPLLAGLIAGIVGGVVVGLLSGSEVSVSGPAAGLAVIVLDSIRTIGSYEAFLVAVVLAGLIQLVMGLLKVGRFSSFFPNSVIRGMLVGIGIVIILKQIPHALGRDSDYEGEFEFGQLADRENTLTEIYEAISTANPGAVVISLVSMFMLVFLARMETNRRRFQKFLPSAVAVILVGVGLNQLFKLVMPDWYLGDSSAHMVQIPIASAQNKIHSLITTPDFSILANLRVYGIAATIALVASLESLLNIEASERIDPLRRIPSPSQELIAQGVGNIISGLIGGLPVTSVVVRTSANIMSGVRTRLSTIFNGVLLILSLFLAGSVLNHIPLSCLTALLIVIGYRLAQPRIIWGIYQEGLSQFIPFIITVLSIIFINLLVGIIIGTIVGLLFVLYTNSQSSFRVIREGNNVLVKFQRDMYFLSKPQLKETLLALKRGDSVLIDGRYATFIDNDIYTFLIDFEQTAKTMGVGYELRQINQPKRIAPAYATI